MWSTLEFVMVGCLFVDLVVARGAQVWTWLVGAEQTVVTAVENEVKKL